MSALLSVPQGLASLEEAKLMPPGGGAFAYSFGSSVAVLGNTAVCGASAADHQGAQNVGAAYVFVRNGTTWSQQAKLVANNAAIDDSFGDSVGISGDTIVVGASGDDNGNGMNAGSAYVFVGNGTAWSQQAKLMASDGAPFDDFGISVGISGDTIVVGAYFDNNQGGADAGSAYVFVRNGTTWTEQAKLTASNPGTFELFGCSSAIEGDTIVVGAPYDSSYAGAAYVFARSGTAWSEQARLTPADGVWVGWSVAISGDRIAVGAPLAGNNVAGRAYVYLRAGTSWSEESKIKPGDGAYEDRFGRSVSITSDIIVVGAPWDDNEGGSDAGSAYTFVRDGAQWSQQSKLTASDGRAGDVFGSSTGISGDTLLAGAPSEDNPAGLEAGSAYVFRTPPVNYCQAGISASGCTAAISATGSASATSSTGFFLKGMGVEGSKDGHFFFGSNGRQENSWGNGTSFQCVVPPVHRAGLLAGSGTNGFCDGAFSQDLNARWCPTCPKPQHNPGAGAVVQAQLWYRDPLNTSNQATSLSDAIEFVVGL